jgi:hypothetical protein
MLCVLAACAQGHRSDDGDDRASNELDQIPQHASQNACSGGRWTCFARIQLDDSTHRIKPLASPSGLGATDLASAYKLDTSLLPNATIAIVDAYDYPNAEADLAKYRAQYGLPPCTVANGCLKIVNQNGQTSPLPGNAPAGDDWPRRGRARSRHGERRVPEVQAAVRRGERRPERPPVHRAECRRAARRDGDQQQLGRSRGREHRELRDLLQPSGRRHLRRGR